MWKLLFALLLLVFVLFRAPSVNAQCCPSGGCSPSICPAPAAMPSPCPPAAETLKIKSGFGATGVGKCIATHAGVLPRIHPVRSVCRGITKVTENRPVRHVVRRAASVPFKIIGRCRD